MEKRHAIGMQHVEKPPFVIARAIEYSILIVHIFQKYARLLFTARNNLGTAHTITSNNQLKPGTGYTNIF